MGCDAVIYGVLWWLCRDYEGWYCDFSHLYEEKDDVVVPNWSDLKVDDCEYSCQNGSPDPAHLLASQQN